jgi:hypothetical protein
MPRANLTVTKLNRDGVTDVTPTTGDATNGHAMANTGITVLRVQNAHATLAKTVTFVTPGSVDGQAVADRTESIPALTTQFFGDFQPSIYGSSLGINVESTDIKLTAYEP